MGAWASRRTSTTNRESLQFVTDFTYDELGNALTTVYPDCTGATCPTGDRLKGVATDTGRVIYRPKGGARGVTANVEVILTSGTRVNVHIIP